MAEPSEGYEDWSAVHQAIMARLDQSGMSLAQLCRISGVAENTIRSMETRLSGNESPLVAIAAVLKWPWPFDHLRNILHGEGQKNDSPEQAQESADSVLESRFRQALQAELGPVKEDMVELRGVVDRIYAKVDRIAPGPDNGTADQA